MRRGEKAKIKVDNHLGGSYGETITSPGRPAIIKINVKKHRGDKAELADTIKHELMHAKHPKMHEKTVYKKMEKPMSRAEQDAMLAKLRMQKLNYKSGVIKRKLKITRHEKTQPGSLIQKMNEMNQEAKITKTNDSLNQTEKVSIAGLV